MALARGHLVPNLRRHVPPTYLTSDMTPTLMCGCLAIVETYLLTVTPSLRCPILPFPSNCILVSGFSSKNIWISY